VVTTEEGQSLANDFGIQFFETSAKTDINVEKAFVTIAREVRALLLLMPMRLQIIVSPRLAMCYTLLMRF